ncbi:hypothetical protein BD626DRAFT_160251 [Schizophyllum amplum]|uniref:Uncharacterized protein n=1 Tax=Schizophyllum amplum TaxID=97359 RepID=A0A550CP04_9AGAR|nr:hypothetical protein BD626DRAFT_160251 [Auriculariopsis ampla]
MLGLWRGAPDLRGAGEGEDCAAEGRAHSDGAQRRRELDDGRSVLRCGRGDLGYGVTRVALAFVDGDGGHRCAAGNRAQSDGAQRRRKLHCRRFLAKGSTGRQPGLRTAGGGDTTARPEAAHGGGGAQRRRARHCLRSRRLRRRPDPGKEQGASHVLWSNVELIFLQRTLSSAEHGLPCSRSLYASHQAHPPILPWNSVGDDYMYRLPATKFTPPSATMYTHARRRCMAVPRATSLTFSTTPRRICGRHVDLDLNGTALR